MHVQVPMVLHVLGGARPPPHAAGAQMPPPPWERRPPAPGLLRCFRMAAAELVDDVADVQQVVRRHDVLGSLSQQNHLAILSPSLAAPAPGAALCSTDSSRGAVLGSFPSSLLRTKTRILVRTVKPYGVTALM